MKLITFMVEGEITWNLSVTWKRHIFVVIIIFWFKYILLSNAISIIISFHFNEIVIPLPPFLLLFFQGKYKSAIDQNYWLKKSTPKVRLSLLRTMCNELHWFYWSKIDLVTKAVSIDTDIIAKLAGVVSHTIVISNYPGCSLTKWPFYWRPFQCVMTHLHLYIISNTLLSKVLKNKFLLSFLYVC